MKEGYWGVLIITLGLFGIVIMQVFQNVVVTNDNTYYLVKEVTEAAMIDAIDLTYYRTKGQLKIVEDKFVENFTRRFSESSTLNREYNVRIHEVIETPPKVSLSIGTYVISLEGEQFNIKQTVDAILESKYTYDEIKEYIGEYKPGTEPLEEDNMCPVCKEGEDPNCKAVRECINGDLRFVGWEDINVSEKICKGDTLSPRTRDAMYQSCECGKWENKSEGITASPAYGATEYSYTWNFKKTSEVRTIESSTTEKGVYDVCTTGVRCPEGGYKIIVGQSLTIVPIYEPTNAVNRGLTWKSSNESVATVQYPNPSTIGHAGTSRAVVRGLTKGESTITATTTNNKSGTCKVEVISQADWACPSTTLEMETQSIKQATLKDGYIPTGVTWKISNTNIATIDSKGLITSKNTAATINYTVSADGLPTLTCPLKVVKKKVEETPGNTGTSGCTPGSIAVDWNIGNKKLPSLCPQDFELQSSCGGLSPDCGTEMPAKNKLGIIENKVSYCGRFGGYTYPEKSKWDYTDRFNITLTTGQVSLNESGGTYSVRVTRTYTYDYSFWSTDVSPYIRGVSGVSKTETLTGTLKNRNLAECKATTVDLTPKIEITGSPGEMVVGTAGSQLRAIITNPTALVEGSGKWVSSNSNIIKVSSTGIITAVGVGTATVRYVADVKAGGAVQGVSTPINVYGACSSAKINVDDTTITVDKTVKATFNPTFGGASAWSSSNNTALELKSGAGTLSSTATFEAIKKGKYVITSIRAVDGCTKTVTITIKPVYVCPSGYPTPFNKTDYCYSPFKKAPFTKCPSSHPYSGYSAAAGGTVCFRTSTDAMYGYNPDYVKFSLCDPMRTGYIAAEKQCYYLKKKVEK